MAIKYLKGNVLANTSQGLKSFRPDGFDFPRGLKLEVPVQTFDALIIGGGGGSGGRSNPNPGPEGGTCRGGAGGGGGFRLLSANSFSDVINTESFSFGGGACVCIPIVIGGGGGGGWTFVAGSGSESRFTPLLTSAGGGGGAGNQYQPGGLPGASGGGGGRGGAGGTGCAGQGCPGGASTGQDTNGSGGSACANGGNGPPTPGITNSFTGASVQYSCGGGNATTPASFVGGGAGQPGGPNQSGSSGQSGLVAIRYCNPAAPTTPLMSGGNTVCCTGGCIIHVFTATGFLCTTVNYPVN